jgi:hypothetical protein
MGFRLLIVFWTCVITSGYAQHLLPVFHDSVVSDDISHEFIASGWAEHFSTALHKDLTNKLFYGGEITEESKSRSFDKHKGINRFGADASAELEYRNYKIQFFGKEKYGLLLKGGYYNYGALVYGKDLFGLTFYGNNRYAGQTIDLSGTRFTGMSFQKFGFGIFDKVMKHSVTINAYSISNYANLNLFDTRIYQSQDIDTMDLTLDGNLDLATASQWAKGWGVGLDLDYYLPVRVSEKKSAMIRFQAKDLGICYFNHPLTRYQSDTTIRYQGYTLDQLINVNNGTSQPSFSDTLALDSLGAKKWRFMPAFIQIGKVVSENDSSRLQTFYGIRLYGLSGYIPMLFAGVHLDLGKLFDLGVSAGYGGWGGFRVGVYANAKLGNLSLAIGSENLPGVFLKNSKGESIALRLRCVF